MPQFFSRLLGNPTATRETHKEGNLGMEQDFEALKSASCEVVSPTPAQTALKTGKKGFS